MVFYHLIRLPENLNKHNDIYHEPFVIGFTNNQQHWMI